MGLLDSVADAVFKAGLERARALIIIALLLVLLAPTAAAAYLTWNTTSQTNSVTSKVLEAVQAHATHSDQRDEQLQQTLSNFMDTQTRIESSHNDLLFEICLNLASLNQDKTAPSRCNAAYKRTPGTDTSK